MRNNSFKNIQYELELSNITQKNLCCIKHISLVPHTPIQFFILWTIVSSSPFYHSFTKLPKQKYIYNFCMHFGGEEDRQGLL